jgi:hypothetical protein
MKNVGTVEVLTERGVRAFPHEEETVLVPSVSRVRMATAAALAACTLTGNVLEADAAGAVGDIDTTVTPAVGDLILVKNQVAGLQNGVYEFLSVGGTTETWKLRRAVGWDVSARVKAGRIVAVSEGTANGNSAFLLTTNDPITLNSTVLVFGSALAVALGAASVTNAMLAPNSVDSDQYVDGSIDGVHIADGAVTAGKLANGAGLAALIATGLGASVNVDNAAGAPVSALAADAVNDRAVLVVVVVTEALTTTAEFAVATVGGLAIRAVPALTALGAVLVGAATVPASVADSEIVVTPTAGATGAVAVTVLALPTA